MSDNPFRICPSVMAATSEELFKAGWADFERSDIPHDWLERRPRVKRNKGGRPRVLPIKRKYRNRIVSRITYQPVKMGQLFRMKEAA